ncbi:MAG TPA: hypothetical protein VKC62_05550 [Gaiellaceae bacterium]|nr:hypothetical protein [Gaiellaceae bacterium]
MSSSSSSDVRLAPATIGETEDEFRGRADEIELGVQRGNDAAEHLYEANGLTEVESPHGELGFRTLRRRLDG